jgi:hypothetical protein
VTLALLRFGSALELGTTAFTWLHLGPTVIILSFNEEAIMQNQEPNASANAPVYVPFLRSLSSDVVERWKLDHIIVSYSGQECDRMCVYFLEIPLRRSRVGMYSIE